MEQDTQPRSRRQSLPPSVVKVLGDYVLPRFSLLGIKGRGRYGSGRKAGGARRTSDISHIFKYGRFKPNQRRACTMTNCF